jgi:hypothetical protein
MTPSALLLPCPFCGHPHPVMRARHAGPVTARRVHSRRTGRVYRAYDRGPCLGFEAACAPCGAVLYRPWSASATQAAIRRAVAAAWNSRAPQCPPGPDGLPPCPLCGWPRPVACAVWGSYAGRRYLADTLRCAECGLRLTPGWRDYSRAWDQYGGGARHQADAGHASARDADELARAWRTRQGLADWRLLEACAPVEPRRCVIALPNALDAVFWGDAGGA